MRKITLLGITISSFLLVLTPCINAIESNEVMKEIKTKSMDELNTIQSIFSNIKDGGLISSIISIIILLLYLPGFIVFFTMLLEILIYPSPPYWPGAPLIVVVLLSFILSVFWPLLLIWVFS